MGPNHPRPKYASMLMAKGMAVSQLCEISQVLCSTIQGLRSTFCHLDTHPLFSEYSLAPCWWALNFDLCSKSLCLRKFPLTRCYQSTQVNSLFCFKILWIISTKSIGQDGWREWGWFRMYLSWYCYRQLEVFAAFTHKSRKSKIWIV